MLAAEHLSVRYGNLTIVSDISFSVREGEWLMLVGPNGAGKSTILNAIGQGVPYTGTVSFEGQDIKRLKAKTRAAYIGALSQNHFVGYEFTVAEVVRLGRYAYGRADGGAEAAVMQALADVGLTEKANQSVTTLSGGELQRTFLAQALCQNPRVLLLDEPANHLDLVYQKQIFSLIGTWLHAGGRAVISVVHDLSLARRFGTDALLLNEGQSIAFGPARDVLKNDILSAVYGLDVRGWMQSLFTQWEESI